MILQINVSSIVIDNIVTGCQGQFIGQDQAWKQIRWGDSLTPPVTFQQQDPVPDNGRVDLILSVLENSLLCCLLLIIRLLQLDLEKGGRGVILNQDGFLK